MGCFTGFHIFSYLWSNDPLLSIYMRYTLKTSIFLSMFSPVSACLCWGMKKILRVRDVCLVPASAALSIKWKKVKWKFVSQSSPTLWDPTDCNPPGCSVHGILQAKIVEWVVIPFSRRSSWPRGWTQVPCIAGGFFTVWATRESIK